MPSMTRTWKFCTCFMGARTSKGGLVNSGGRAYSVIVWIVRAHLARGGRPPAPSFMPTHRGIRLGVAHEQIHHQRNADHAGEVVVEPGFMAERLEPQGDRVRGAAEDRHRDGVGEPDPDGANFGRE